MSELGRDDDTPRRDWEYDVYRRADEDDRLRHPSPHTANIRPAYDYVDAHGEIRHVECPPRPPLDLRSMFVEEWRKALRSEDDAASVEAPQPKETRHQ